MKLWIQLGLLAGALVSVPTTAMACRSSSNHRYIIADKAPLSVPKGFRLLRVKLLSVTEVGVPTGAVEVIEGRYRGKRFLVRPELWTSCTLWGVEKGFSGYLIGKADLRNRIITP